MASFNSTEKLGDIVVGVIFWISAWQLAGLLTDHLSKKKRIAIYTFLVVITILVLAAIYTHRQKRELAEKESAQSASSFE